MTHRLLARVARSAAFDAIVRGLELLGDGRPGLLTVLTYHRIARPGEFPDLHPGLLSATPADFERQMAWVARTCRVVTAAEAVAAFDGRTTLPARSVWITFDDAYEDFASVAWPVLGRLGVPVTLFVPTGFPDRPDRAFWWDRLHRVIQQAPAGGTLELGGTRLPVGSEASRSASRRAAERYLSGIPHARALEEIERLESTIGTTPAPNRVLGWSELRRLAGDGVVLAPHSRSHPLMNRIATDDAIAEAVGSLRDLEREVRDVPPCFAYPGGVYPDDLPSRLAEHGFRVGLTTRRGANVVGSTDPLRLRRINVGLATSLALMRAQLLPWVHRFGPYSPVAGSRRSEGS